MTSLNLDDLERARRDRLARAQGQVDGAAQRAAGNTSTVQPRPITKPSTEEEALSGFASLQLSNTPDIDSPASQKKLFGQSVVDAMVAASKGERTIGKKGVPFLLQSGGGIKYALNVLDWGTSVAQSIVRPIIFGAQNFIIPGQQEFQRVVNAKRDSGLSFGQALNEAYEETNLEGPTISFVPETAFTPNGTITIDFEDVIEAGFDPIDLALTLGTGGIGKGLSTAGKQGAKAGARVALAESRAARIAGSTARTVKGLAQDPGSLVGPAKRTNLLENVAPIRTKVKIAANLPGIEDAEKATLRDKSTTRLASKIANNVPLARRILGAKPFQKIAELADPSQTVGDSAAKKFRVLGEQYGALGANATDAIIGYVQPDNLRKAFNYSVRDGRIQATNIKLTPEGSRLARAGKVAGEGPEGFVQPLMGDLMEGALFDDTGRSLRNSLYTGLDAGQRKALQDYRDATDAVVQMLVDEGLVKLKDGAVAGRLWKFASEVETGTSIEDIFYYVKRTVRDETYIDKDGVAQKLTVNRAPGPRGGNRSFEESRLFEFMEEGARDGVRTYADPIETLEALAGGGYRLVAEKRLKDFLIRENQIVTGDSVYRRLYPQLAQALDQAEKFSKATAANVNRLRRKAAVRTAKRTPMVDELGRADATVKAAIKEHGRLTAKYKDLFIRHGQQVDKAKKAANDGLRRKHRATAQRLEGRMIEMSSEVARAGSAFRQAMEGTFKGAEGTNVAIRARNRLARLEDEMMGITDDLLTADAEADLARRTLERARIAQTDQINQIMSARTVDASIFYPDAVSGSKVAIGRFDRGALQGHLAPMDTVDIINKYYNDRGIDVLRKIEGITGTARTISTGTADVGWLTIQGSLLAVTHPIAYAKAAGKSLQAIKNPALREKYLRENMADLIDGIENGLDIGSSEFFQALDRGGAIARVNQWALNKTEAGTLLGDAVEKWGRHVQPIGRLGAGFNMYLDYSKLEMWKSMRNMPLGGAVTKRELATHINNMMGTMNTQLLGLSPTQRQIEGSLLFFSPRYTRSAFALIGDLLNGPGAIGTMDGLAQRHAMRAIGGFVAAGTGAMWAIGEATGQEVELNPMKPGWLTVEIGGQRLGIGGSTRALLDVTFKALASASGVDGKEVDDLFRFNLFDPEHRRANPLLQYWLNRTPPGVREVLTGETFDGEQLDRISPRMLAELGKKFMPFAAQAYFDPPQGVARQSPFALIPEGLGLRARPLSAFERRNKKRDELAQQTAGKPWEELGFDERAVLRRDYPDLQGLEEIARNIEDPVFTPYFDKLNRDRQITERAVANAAAQFRVNPAGGRTFRQAYDEAIAQDRLLREVREDPKGEYAGAISKLEDLRADKRDSQTEFDRLRDEYISDVRDNPDFRDVFGNVDFRSLDAAEKEFKAKVGPEMFQRIRNYYLGFDANGQPLNSDTPQEVVALRRAREVLRQTEYWKIPEKYIGDNEQLQDVWDEYQSLDSPAARQALGRRFPEIGRIASKVDRDRQRLRRGNADVDRALVLFYGLRAANRQVRQEERALIQFSRSQGRTTTEGSFQIS